MKQKISTAIFLFFLQAVSYAQIDSLVLVKQSRISYCNGKIQQVAILNDRLLVKDSAIVISNQRIDKKEEEIKLYQKDIDTYKQQLSIKVTINKIVSQQNEELKIENKQLKKKGLVKTLGIVGLTVLTITSWTLYVISGITN